MDSSLIAKSVCNYEENSELTSANQVGSFQDRMSSKSHSSNLHLKTLDRPDKTPFWNDANKLDWFAKRMVAIPSKSPSTILPSNSVTFDGVHKWDIFYIRQKNWPNHFIFFVRRSLSSNTWDTFSALFSKPSSLDPLPVPPPPPIRGISFSKNMHVKLKLRCGQHIYFWIGKNLKWEIWRY